MPLPPGLVRGWRDGWAFGWGPGHNPHFDVPSNTGGPVELIELQPVELITLGEPTEVELVTL